MSTLHASSGAPAFRIPRTLLVFGALAIVYVTWGSTYLAIRIAVEHVPPFLLAAARFLAAGAILYGFLRLRGAGRPSLKAWGAASVVGIATFVVSHGLLAWASQHVPSGTAALLSSSSPAWIALGGVLGLVGSHRPGSLALGGVVLGLLGVLVTADPQSVLQGGTSLAAVGALLAGSLAWAVGGVLSRWSALPASAPLSASMSMLTGGGMLLALSLLLGEPGRVDVAAVPAAAWGAMGYLTLAGSVIAYSAYVWLLREDGPARVSAHSFVNPLIAVGLGAAVAGEALSMSTIVGGALVVLGVALMSLAPRIQAAAARRASMGGVSRGRCTAC